MAIAGKNAKVLTYSTETVFTTQATTTTDNENYQITDTTKNVWGMNSVIEVYVGGVLQASTLYSLNRLAGKITFLTVAARTVTVSGSYLPVVPVVQAHEFDYVLTATNIDSTIFGDQFIERTQGLKDVTGTLSKFYDGSDYFSNTLIADNDFVIEFYNIATAGATFRVWAKIDKGDIDAAVDGVVQQKVDFSSTNDIDYNCFSFGPF